MAETIDHASMNAHPTKEMLTTEAARHLQEIEARPEALKPKDRLKIPTQAMPAQDPAVRCGNIEEVAQGYSPEQAHLEALRCLQCKQAPCIEGCPVRIDIPGFVRAIAEGHVKQAIDIIKLNSLLPWSAGACARRKCNARQPARWAARSRTSARPYPLDDWSASRPTGSARKAPRTFRRSSRPRAKSGRDRQRSGRHHRGRRRTARRSCSHSVRGLSQARRRHGIRHPRVPVAQVNRTGRN